jgi:membrane associated rhomboid family serine protease
MIPLSDENPARSIPVVTISLVALNVAVYVYQLSLGSQVEGFIQACAFRPAELLTGQDIPPPNCVQPPWLTVLTSLFLHAGLLHLGSNLLFLWIFGNNVEDAMGHLRYATFYLLCGVGAALAQTAFTLTFRPEEAAIPNLGASGAIAGVLGAYLVLFPQARVRTLVFLGFFITFTRIPALVLLGLWFVLQFFQGIVSVGSADTGGVAVWAHVGGFVLGLLLVRLFARGQGAGRTRPAYHP